MSLCMSSFLLTLAHRALIITKPGCTSSFPLTLAHYALTVANPSIMYVDFLSHLSPLCADCRQSQYGVRRAPFSHYPTIALTAANLRLMCVKYPTHINPPCADCGQIPALHTFLQYNCKDANSSKI
ncbi:hypothetical protein DL96DRAFT_351687 [Flagelloscypha sp. PMI_526]|nr:hypothetical protein DL96DRAFT_351687 [Flagelloscypha sp. PMI_526]